MAKTAKWQVLKSKGDKLAKRSVYMYIAPGAHNDTKWKGHLFISVFIMLFRKIAVLGHFFFKKLSHKNFSLYGSLIYIHNSGNIMN